MKSYEGETIWVVGASSGIGRALAIELYQAGARLVLSARNVAALHQLNGELKNSCLIIPLDIQKPADVQKAADDLFKDATLTRVICLAGSYTPMSIESLDLAEVSTIISTNLLGPINLTRAVLPYFLKEKKGQLAFCASVAGYMGLPRGQPYGASKAGLINFVESLYLECAKSGVDVKLISPGFVKTPLTDKNTFKMPMIIEPPEAAHHIALGLQEKAFEIHFPRKFTWMLKILRLLPYPLYLRLVQP